MARFRRYRREELEGDALDVALELIGAELRAGKVRLRITETEAYRHGGDTANHCRVGRTARNEPMWGEAGRAYIYLCYGVHHLLNVVTGREGEGAAVLVRGAEIVAGEREVLARRGRSGDARDLLAGPGKVAQALELTRAQSGESLLGGGKVELWHGETPRAVLVGPRIGIAYASPEDQRAPYRFADASGVGVSRLRELRPFGA